MEQSLSNEDNPNLDFLLNIRQCNQTFTEHLRGIDLLYAINDSIRVTIGVAFLSHGFHISKYNYITMLRRTIIYTIFILIYKQYISKKILKVV